MQNNRFHRADSKKYYLPCRLIQLLKVGLKSLNVSASVSQALKIGDNNVIESKGKFWNHSLVCDVICVYCCSCYNRFSVTEIWKQAMQLYHFLISYALILFPCEIPADLGRNVILSSGCIIGACCHLNSCEVVPENTVVYGSGCIRRVQSEKPQVRVERRCLSCQSVSGLFICWGVLILYVHINLWFICIASDSATGLPHEDPA